MLMRFPIFVDETSGRVGQGAINHGAQACGVRAHETEGKPWA